MRSLLAFQVTHGACQLWGGFKKMVYSMQEVEERGRYCVKVTGELPRNRSLIPGRGERFTTFPKLPDRLWGSNQLLIQWVPRVFSPGG